MFFLYFCLSISHVTEYICVFIYVYACVYLICVSAFLYTYKLASLPASLNANLSLAFNRNIPRNGLRFNLSPTFLTSFPFPPSYYFPFIPSPFLPSSPVPSFSVDPAAQYQYPL